MFTVVSGSFHTIHCFSACQTEPQLALIQSEQINRPVVELEIILACTVNGEYARV